MNSYKRNNSVLTFFPSFLNTIFEKNEKNASIISHIISNWKAKQKKESYKLNWINQQKHGANF